MISVNIRKQGGAAVITLPMFVLKTLHMEVGNALKLSIHKNTLLLEPVSKKPLPRYSLEELLAGTTSKTMKALNMETAWARDGKSVGRELI